MEKQISKVGRPTKFSPKDIELVYELGTRGCNPSTFCAIRKISRTTYYEWKKNSSEFKEAAEAGLEANLSYYLTVLKEIGEGERKGNVAAIKEVLDRTHGSVQAADKSKTEINIGNMNVLQTLSEDDLKAKIADKLKILNLRQDATNDAYEPPEAA